MYSGASSRQSFEVLLKTRAIVDVCDRRAEQVTLAHVCSGQPLASHRAHFHCDHAARNVQREIQAVRAATESFVDDCGRKHHAHTGGAEIVRPAQKDQGRFAVLDVVVEQRQGGRELDFTPDSEPAHLASFN